MSHQAAAAKQLTKTASNSLTKYLVSRADCLVFDDLYTNSPATALLVVGELPEMAQQIVMRLVCIDQPIPKSIIIGWFNNHTGQRSSSSSTESIVGEACQALTDLRVWYSQDLLDLARSSFALNKRFQTSLRIGLFGGGGGPKQLGDTGSSASDRNFKDLQFIKVYANEKWEQNHLPFVPAFQLLCQLRSLDIYKSYPVDAVGTTNQQQQALAHLRDIGLVYMRKPGASRFQITPLALLDADLNVLTQPTSYSSSLNTHQPTSDDEAGYIIVETNFRLYAYTDSPLRTGLLSLFSKIRARFPNLIVADITRDSVREALLRGVSAKQSTILPSTVIDQLLLWELERDRFIFHEGCLYEQFSKASDFELVRDYAKSINVLLWENTERRLMVVSKSGHEDVRRFWKQKRPS